jgi:hypothetical protein
VLLKFKYEMTAYEYLCFKSDIQDWKDAVKAGDMTKEEMKEEIDKVMKQKGNRQKKKSRIVKEVNKEEREKRK